MPQSPNRSAHPPATGAPQSAPESPDALAARVASERARIEASEADIAAGDYLADGAARAWLRAWAAGDPLPEDGEEPKGEPVPGGSGRP